MKVRHIKRRQVPTNARLGATSWVIEHEFKGRDPLPKRMLHLLHLRSYWK